MVLSWGTFKSMTQAAVRSASQPGYAHLQWLTGHVAAALVSGTWLRAQKAPFRDSQARSDGVQLNQDARPDKVAFRFPSSQAASITIAFPNSSTSACRVIKSRGQRMFVPQRNTIAGRPRLLTWRAQDR